MNPKKLLDDLRLLCRSKSKAIPEVYANFNLETRLRTQYGRYVGSKNEEKQLKRKNELKAEKN